MSKLAQLMEPLAPMTNRDRLRAYGMRLAARPEHDPNEHARRAIKGELWRHSLAKQFNIPTASPPVRRRDQSASVNSP